MAVTIDEMHLEVQQPAPPVKAAEPSAKPKKEDYHQALSAHYERQLRLIAD